MDERQDIGFIQKKKGIRMTIGIRMLVTDLDKTLLKSDKTISEITIESLRKLKNKDIRIAIATARPARTADSYLKRINGDAAILLNGALVMAEGKIIQRHSIKSDIVKALIQEIKDVYPTVTLSVEMGDILYADFDLNQEWEYKRIDFNYLPDGLVDKIILGSIDLCEIKKINTMLPEYLYAESNSGKFIMIMNKSACKHFGLLKLSEYFDIPMEEILAFGDDYNDIGMLRECGIGVAMADACNEAKEAADYITDTSDNEGVSSFIINNLL
jgi:Cof subfamily protein (haloacid dehalogenase superfamily)